jgi:hypothetical protein
MTIAKNTKRAKKAIANATDVRCFSLSNDFSGKLIEVGHLSGFLSRELAGLHAKLTVGENGHYRIYVHSNLWYEFEAA